MRGALLSAAALAAFASGCAVQRLQSGRFLHFASYRLFNANAAEECWTEKEWKACVYRPKKARVSGDVVYFMHYATGSELGFGEIGLANAFYSELAKAKAPPPSVVSVSFGTHWLLTRGERGKQVVPLRKFLGEVVPSVESRLGAPKRRFAWGMSMGGFNALQLALAKPDGFSAAVLSCPALHAVDPMKHGDEAPKLAARARVPLNWADDGMALFYHRIPAEDWPAEDPAARVAKGEPLPPLLLQANRDDEYGFYEGAEAFYAALKKAGREASFSPLPGGHCVVDAREAARFFAARP